MHFSNSFCISESDILLKISKLDDLDKSEAKDLQVVYQLKSFFN